MSGQDRLRVHLSMNVLLFLVHKAK